MIFLLAGHSNKDSGAVGVGGILERDETISLRDLIATHIPSKYRVFKDNDSDSLHTVLQKATTGSGSVVLDIHFNASTDARPRGVEIIVADSANTDVLNYAHRVLRAVTDGTNIPSRGIKYERDTPRGRLGVLRESGLVCVLEVEFITNKQAMLDYNKHKVAIAKRLAVELCNSDDIRS